MRMKPTSEFGCHVCQGSFPLSQTTRFKASQIPMLVVLGSVSTLGQALDSAICQGCTKEDGLPSLLSVLEALGYNYGDMLIRGHEEIGDASVSKAVHLADSHQVTHPRDRHTDRVLVEKPTRVTLGDLIGDKTDQLRQAVDTVEESRALVHQAHMNTAKEYLREIRCKAKTHDVNELVEQFYSAVDAACVHDKRGRNRKALVRLSGTSREELRHLSVLHFASMTALPGDAPFEPRRLEVRRSFEGVVIEKISVPASVGADIDGFYENSPFQTEVVRLGGSGAMFPEPNQPIEKAAHGSTLEISSSEAVKIIYPRGYMYGDSPRIQLETDKYAYKLDQDLLLGKGMFVQMRVVNGGWVYIPVLKNREVNDQLIGSVSKGLRFHGWTDDHLFEIRSISEDSLALALDIDGSDSRLVLVFSAKDAVFTTSLTVPVQAGDTPVQSVQA